MKKKFLKVGIVLTMVVMVYATIANALSFTATMTPSKNAVPESTEFTVSVKVSNLDVGTNGINSLSGTLKYDDSIFEPISDSSIEGVNSWTPTYNSQNGKITLTKTTFVKSEETVFQIVFKTKAGNTGKTGTISFTDIVASNSAADISASDISTTITVGTEADIVNNTNTNSNTNTNTPVIVANTNSNNGRNININTVSNNTLTNTNRNNTTNNTNTNSNRAVSSYVNTSNVTSNEDIPYTGVEDTIIYIIGAVIILAIVFYIKFEKVNKEMK